MMLTQIRKLLAPPVFEGDEEKTRIARLLNGIIWVMFILVIITAPPITIFNETALGRNISLIIMGIMVSATLGLLWLMHRGRPRLAGTLILLLLLTVITLSIPFFGGIRGTNIAGYFMIIGMVSLLLSRREIVFFGLAISLIVLGLFWAERTYESIPIFPLGLQPGLGDLIVFLGAFFLMAVLMDFALNDLTRALARARRGERELVASNRELRASRDALQAATSDLERRNRQIRLASEVARDAAAARNLEQALELSVNLMQARLGFYHVALFLIDEQREYVLLRAAAGDRAEQVLRQGFRVKVGGQGAVGQVTAAGRPYHVRDTEEDPIYVKQPLLPETRSELMLPLQARDEIIGAIGVLSREANAFDESDIAVLQTMIGQLAATIQNARLLTKMQQTVQELEIASERYTREAWGAVSRRVGRVPGYRYRGLDVEPAHEYPEEASTKTAWRRGRSVVTTQSEGNNHNGTNAAAIPIKFRDQVIGMFKLSSKESAISSQTLSLVEETAERLALALENARLLEETQRRAAREQLTSDIATQVRASLDLDAILKATVRELGQALGTERVSIEMMSPVQRDEDVSEDPEERREHE